MAPFKIIYSYRDDHFLAQLKQMQQSLKELGEIMDRQNQQRSYMPPLVVTRRVVVERQTPQRAPALVFPFSLLAYLIEGALQRFDRAIARFVDRVIARWMHWLQRFLRPKKRS